MEWPFIKVGDKVKITSEGLEVFTGSDFCAHNRLLKKNYTVIKVFSENTCEDDKPNCSCDKYITVKSLDGNVILENLYLDELILKELV